MLWNSQKACNCMTVFLPFTTFSGKKQTSPPKPHCLSNLCPFSGAILWPKFSLSTQARRLWWCKPTVYWIPCTRWPGPLASMLLHTCMGFRAASSTENMQRATKAMILWNALFLTLLGNHLPEGKTQTSSLNDLSMNKKENYSKAASKSSCNPAQAAVKKENNKSWYYFNFCYYT